MKYIYPNKIFKSISKMIWYVTTYFSLFIIINKFVGLLEDSPTNVGKGGKYIQHDTLGYVPQVGILESKTNEYYSKKNINSYNMNDDAIETSIHKVSHRVMVVGDSYTYAVGVSNHETFSNVLEKNIFPNANGSVYNCGMTGYSLSQYLLKYRQMRDIIKPTILIIGFSMATDLYDLLPPRKGGFIYGAPFGRVYHDLSSNNDLIECYDLVGVKKIKDANKKISAKKEFISGIKNTPLFRLMRQSTVAMYLGSYFASDKLSFWEGVEPALRIQLSTEDAYKWTLAEKLLAQISKEAHERKTKIILFNIAYAPVVYDEIWDNIFGLHPQKYDRMICSKRLALISKLYDIEFIDTTPLFMKNYQDNKKWLHYPDDKHPTAAGHKILAQALAEKIYEKSMLK